MTKLKTIPQVYITNERPGTHGNLGRISKKIYDKAHTTIPKYITNNRNYFWYTGRNKRYSHYTNVQPLNLEEKAYIPDTRFKQIDKTLKLTDFLYDDDITKSEMKLIRNRLKKEPINIKGYITEQKETLHSTYTHRYMTISWIVNDKYAIANIHDFITLLKLKLI